MNGRLSMIAIAFFACLHILAADFYLVKDGKPAAVLIRPQKYSSQVYDAIKDFSFRVGKCTGCELPIYDAAPGAKILFREEDRSPDDMDRYTIDFPSSQIMRITGSKHSIRYALNHLLEKYFGVRYLLAFSKNLAGRPAGYSSDLETEYPVCKDVSVPIRTVTDTASFNFMRGYRAHDPQDWNARLSFCRSHGLAEDVFPWNKYAENNSWPQEILPVLNGKKYVMPVYRPGMGPRQYRQFWQPCYSNPETKRIAVANILEKLEKEPVDTVGYFDDHWKTYAYREKRYFINLDPNDNGGYCQCADCRKAVGGKKNRLGMQNYSELYFRWVNEVANEVTKKYPNVYFRTFAYTQTYDAPDFPLHPNVIVMLCRELYSGLKPDIRHEWEQTLQQWSRKAKVLFVWDYLYGSEYFLLPRFHSGIQAEMTSLCYKYNVRGFGNEQYDPSYFDGPRNYLIARQMWHVNADMDTLLKDWCESAVGKEAAPYLYQYWKFWENYWGSPELLKTSWANSLYSVYTQLGEQGTYTYALRKGDMARLRSLLEDMVEHTRNASESQKKRAKFFLTVFEPSETAVKALYAELLNPDGSLSSASDAAELLRAVPQALEAVENMKKMQKEGRIVRRLVELAERGVVSNVTAVNPFRNDPEVKSAIAELLKKDGLPSTLSAILQLMNGKTYRNLVTNGSFENPDQHPVPLWTWENYSTEHVSHGKYAYKSCNGNYYFYIKGIQPGKTYLAMMDVYIENPSAEGLFNFELAPRSGSRNVDWMRLCDLKLKKGWQTFQFSYKTPVRTFVGKPVDNILLRANCRNFETGEYVWMDNVRLYQLD